MSRCRRRFVAELLLRVQLVSVAVPALRCRRRRLLAELLLRVQLVSVAVPAL